MADSMAGCPTACPGVYCSNCDLLVGLAGLHVIEVDVGDRWTTVTVESAPAVMGCHSCGVVAESRLFGVDGGVAL